jgi:hypothetical protein
MPDPLPFVSRNSNSPQDSIGLLQGGANRDVSAQATDVYQNQLTLTNIYLKRAEEQLEQSVGYTKYKTAVRSNIEQQMAHIVNMGGYARPTRFHLEFTEFNPYVNERLSRNCMSTNLPGRGLQSQPLKIYGPPMEYVYETNYQNELQMTFRVGSDMFERVFFEDWMNTAYSNITADVEYPDVYRRSLKLYQLDMLDKKVLCMRLDDVFCKSVGDIELSTDASDQIETVTVTMGYTQYQIIGKMRVAPKGIAPPEQSIRKPIYPGSMPQILPQLGKTDPTLTGEQEEVMDILKNALNGI